MAESPHDVTALLHAWNDGDAAARDRLLTLIYQELRRRAAVHLRRERPDHTLQPTALVHEAYLRLVDQRAPWHNRGQFFGVACGAFSSIAPVRIGWTNARDNGRASRSTT